MKYKKISFDWDNTIAMSYMVDSDDSELPVYTFQGYNDKIIDLIKEYYNQNIELFIVTSRKRSLEQYYPEDSVHYQLQMLNLSHIFPPARVHFTEGDLKAKTLRDLGVELHYDDSMEEVLECKKAGIDVIPAMDFHPDVNVVGKGIILDLNGDILLLKRTDKGTQWDIPGGHIKKIEHERGLKGLADGFEREVAEETGLIVPHSRLIHKFMHTWKDHTNEMNIILCELEQETPYVDLNIQDFQENSEYIWVPEYEIENYMGNMTEVAVIALQDYLANMNNPVIREAAYLPSQSKSWAKMKKKLVGMGKNKHTGGGKGHTRPKMKKSKAAPPDFAVLEANESKKKELKSKLSESLTKAAKNAGKTRGDAGYSKAKRLIDAMDRILGRGYGSEMTKEEENLLFGESLSEFTKDNNGNPLEMVTIKGSGYGYYYSMSDKKLIMVPKKGEYYLISKIPDEIGRLKVYSHYKFTSGVVLLVPKEEIERIGWN